MLYSLVVNYVFFVVILSHVDRKVREQWHSAKLRGGSRAPSTILSTACFVNLVLVLAMFLNFFWLTNEAYLKSNVANTQTMMFANRLVDRVQRFPGYATGMQICRVGSYNSGAQMSFNDNTVFGVKSKDSLVNSYSYEDFVFGATGEILVIIRSDGIARELISAHMEALQEMAIYPAENSIKIIDDVMYVKFSGI
jgi:hypothetical protein